MRKNIYAMVVVGVLLAALSIGLGSAPSGSGGDGADLDGGPVLALAVDASGAVYLGGSTATFPALGGDAVRPPRAGSDEDFWLAKFDPAGRLLQAIALGGAGRDRLTGLAVDSAGSVFAVGETDSSDFPVTDGTGAGGGTDVFVLRLDGGSLQPLRSRVLGGADFDSATDLALNEGGALVVAGWTRSPDFPSVVGGFASRGGGADAFALGLDPDTLQLEFSSFLGGQGSRNDRASSIALESDGSIVLAGDTSSPDFPVTHSSNPSYNGGADAFVAKLSRDGSELVFSCFLGGGGDDFGSDLALTQDGGIVLVGSTASLDFPTAAARSPFPAGGWDIFLSKLTQDGSRLEFSTYLGGSSDDGGPLRQPRLALHPGGDLLVLGASRSFDFPVSTTRPRSATDDSWGVGLTRWTDSGRLRSSSLFSGPGADLGLDLALDRRGVAWLAGITESDPAPLPSVFPPIASAGAFLSRLGVDPLAQVALLGIEGVTLKKGTFLRSGDVVVNQAGQLSIEKEVNAPIGFRLMADRIDIKKDALVYSNLYFNHLNNRGQVFGHRVDSLELPVISELPGFQPASPGGEDLRVGANSTETLTPGAYGRVTLLQGASLLVEEGEFDLRSLDARGGARILFLGPALVRVAEDFRIDRQVRIGPDAGASIDASDILVVVEGARGHAVDLGRESSVQANFHALSGLLRLGGGVRAEGAFWARETVVEADVDLRLNSYFDVPPAPPNQPPVASPDSAATDEDLPVAIPVLDNDFDPDGDPLAVGGFDQADGGAVSMGPNGELLYSPHPNFHGSDRFLYSVEDGRGGVDSAAVQILVEPVNDPPVARDDEYETNEDLPVEMAVLANDEDPDGDALRLASHTQPARGTVSEAAPGLLVYRPEADFNGIDEYSYRVADPAGAESTARVRISVAPVNDPPQALPDAMETDEDEVAVIAVLANDFDVDGDPLRLASLGAPAHGTVHANPDGSVTYVPELHFNGSDSFEYSIADVAGEVDSAAVRMTVTPVSDPPLAADDFATLDEDASILIPVLANDSDPDGDPLTVAAFTQPGFGRVDAEGEDLLYAPDPNFFGDDRFSYTVTDPSGGVDSAEVLVSVAPINDPPTVELSVSPPSGAVPLEVVFTAEAVDPDGDALEFSWDFGDGSTAGGGAVQTHVYSSAGTFPVALAVDDGEFSVGRQTLVEVLSTLPPNPASVAPRLDLSAVVTVADASRFLYEGDPPIQTGVVPGSIDPVRAAVLRGRVLNRAGDPLPGVEVSIPGRPEWGSTLTRMDGGYDLAVNGGGTLNIEFRKTGHLPAQRRIQPDWQDFDAVDDVVLVEFDSNVAEIDLAAPVGVQVARGSLSSDDDGTRRATVFFPAGTAAEMVMPDGSAQALSRLSVRATEFTVGENGPLAMPAALPPASFYTYALALTVDEALQTGAEEVRFSRPVPLYVENFLDFPVGVGIPLGYFDPRRGEWVAENSGRVLGVLGVSDGLADLDVDGAGLPADPARLAELGIDDSERAQLAALYSPGQTLWRAPIPHFSFWDLNLGWAPPLDAVYPSVLDFFERIWESLDQFCSVEGSIIECENQTLGERIPLAGSPWTLNYRSDRTTGRGTSRRLEIPLSGDSLPASLDAIELEVEVAGRVHRESFPPDPNLRTAFSWDGRDPYGRQLQGGRLATVRVGYTYQGRYSAVDRFNSPPTFDITLTPARTGVTFWEEVETPVGPAWDAFGEGLGGWSLSGRHVYDPLAGILYFGDGARRTVRNLQPVIETAVRAGVETFFDNPDGLAVGPDGTLYIASGISGQVIAVDTDGNVRTVAGTGRPGDDPGDGGPAAEARLDSPRGLAVAADGSLYIAELAGHRVRRVAPDGTIATVAGTGEAGFGGDMGPGPLAKLSGPRGLAIGRDGSLFIADGNNRRVRRLSTDGLISTFAGTGEFGTSGDGGLAASARFRSVRDLAAAADGSLFVLDSEAGTVRRIRPDGRIFRFAGTGGFGPFEDGIPAIDARLETPLGIALAPGGGLLISSGTRDRVRLVRSDGIILTVAGVGERGSAGDGGPAAQAQLTSPGPLACSPEGGYYIGVPGRVRKVRAPLPRFSASDLAVVSEDGSQVYRFDSTGRHLETRHALTGATLLSFSYDSDGRLLRAVDGDGNAIVVERDQSGAATAIVAPLGQRTGLEIDASGRLTAVTDPSGATFRMLYSPDGLLTSWTDPRGNVSTFQYDSLGLLVRDADAAGQVQSLSRSVLPDGYQVVHSTALGRTATKQIRENPIGDRVRLSLFPDGTTATTTESLAGSQTIDFADGTRFEGAISPDPRFGVEAVTSGTATIVAPSGLTQRLERQVTTGPADPDDPSSPEVITQAVRTNGTPLTAVYNPRDRSVVSTSAEGRVSTMALDDQGRLIQRQVGDLFATFLQYDSLGRLSGVVRGSGPEARSVSIDYDAAGCPMRITDPQGAALTMECDAAGRIVGQTLPGGRQVLLDYDANGNPTSLAPPGRPAHSFEYNAADNQTRYAPPDVNSGPEEYFDFYNLDQQLVRIARPDGGDIQFHYDAAGRVESLEIPRGLVRFHYNSAGEVSQIVAPDGAAVAFARDGFLPLATAWTGAVSGEVSRQFNADFQVVSESVNGGQTVAFSYDRDGLLTGAGSLDVELDPQNGLLKETRIGDLRDTWSHNGFAEPIGYAAQFQAANLMEVQWTRDKVGRVVSKTETLLGAPRALEYAYDLSGRLVEVRTDGAITSSFVYDDNGNPVAGVRSGQTFDAVFDERDRLLRQGDVTFAYTAAGDLRTRTENGATTTYRYDALGNLMSVSLPDGSEVEYLVDARNRRIGKKVNGTLRQGFLYSGQLRVVAELDGDGQIVSRFVYGSRRNVPDYMLRDGRALRILSDLIGSPRLVVDVETGEILQRIDYDEFGRVLFDSNPGYQPFGFAGGLEDRQVGLIRFGARDYSPETGRWTAPDPLSFGGGDLNLYAYALNDPINLIDESGQVVQVVIAGAIIGAFTNAYWAALADPLNVDLRSLAAAAASGAVSGGLGALAGPLGGSIARFIGLSSAGLVARGLSVGFSGLGGLLGQALANLIDPGNATSVCIAAGTAGLGAGVASQFVPPARTTRTLSQAWRFRHNVGNLVFFTPGSDSLNLFRAFGISAHVSGISNFF